MTHILKYPVSFHVWKFGTGLVLFVLATISLSFLFTEPLENMTLGYTFVAMTTMLCIGAVMCLSRSTLPYDGSLFLWPFEPRNNRNDWRVIRQPLTVLDIIFIMVAITTVTVFLLEMLPRAPHWQSATFVISVSVMFMMCIALYGTRFLPDKVWIDKIVINGAGLTAVAVCFAMGLQPV